MQRLALFHYRRRVKGAEGQEDSYNDNYINPQSVCSCFWQVNSTGFNILTIFLVNNFSVTLPEAKGKEFLDHMEGFLRAVTNTSVPSTAPVPRETERRERRVPTAIDIVEDEGGDEASWSN